MRFYIFCLVLLVSFAGTASAAGFAKESLFLSTTPVTEGEVVLIHAVVSNTAASAFAGKVVFKDVEEIIGTVAVSIAPGGANAVSVSWEPSAGSHKVTAELTDQDGEVAEAQSATFYIEAKPQPKALTASAVESSDDLQEKIEQLSPTAAKISAPIFLTLDSARIKAADMLDSGIEWAEGTTDGKKPGEVLSAATKDTSSKGIIATLWLVVAMIASYVLSALRFIVGSAGIFYPVFAVLFFYLLWKTFKRFRRPSYG